MAIPSLKVEDFITASGKYPERLNSPELLTNNVMINLHKLRFSINSLFYKLNYNKDLVISSGFRPSSINAALPNSAKKSAHMTGLAVDLSDPDGSLDKLLVDNIDVLKSLNLWLEDPASTVGWAHIDLVQRVPRDKNIFKP